MIKTNLCIFMLWINTACLFLLIDIFNFSIIDFLNLTEIISINNTGLKLLLNYIIIIIIFIYNIINECVNILIFFKPSQIFIYWNTSIIYGIKFCFSLLFLIFIRAGIPRYRYDFLTILGWNKFLFFCLFIFIYLIILYFFQ